MATKTVKKETKSKIKEVVPTKVVLNSIASFKGYLSLEQSFNSCGVYMVDCVDSAFRRNIISSPRSTSRMSTLRYRAKLKYLKDNFKKILDESNHGSECAFYNISLNKDSHKDLINILDEVCKSKTEWELNPNSGNQIKVWMV